MYINKSDDIVNKYNSTYHNTIKMKPVDENQAHILRGTAKNKFKRVHN